MSIFLRIDNRLVHGQVATAWLQFSRAKSLVVANDEAATDPIQRIIITTAIPRGCKGDILTVEDAVKTVPERSERESLFIVVKTPRDVVRLVEGGVPITSINIGNMHYIDGKQKVTNYIYTDEQDVADFQELHRRGIELDARWLPRERSRNLAELLQFS